MVIDKSIYGNTPSIVIDKGIKLEELYYKPFCEELLNKIIENSDTKPDPVNNADDLFTDEPLPYSIMRCINGSN